MAIEVDPTQRGKETNEVTLFSRTNQYNTALNRFHNNIQQMIQLYGNWPAIPNKLRTQTSQDLRRAGFIYHPKTGWFPPNSVGLSSINEKS